MIGLMGRKVGMTQVFQSDGTVVPVTVIATSGNRVVGLRTKEKNNYEAVQVGFEEDKKEKRKTILCNFPEKKKPRHVREFRFNKRSSVNFDEYKVGQELSVSLFKVGGFLDIQGVSIGKGFQGVMKRYGMHGGPASHGSHFHRGPGSIGHCTEPARVFKGKKLPGRMGNQKVMVQNLSLVDVDEGKGIIMVKGAVPGKRNSLLVIRNSLKRVKEMSASEASADKKGDKK